MSVSNDHYVKNNLDVTGNISVLGIVDGRDIASDGIAQDSHIDNDEKHRLINDLSTSTTELWSSNKITDLLDTKVDLSTKNVAYGYAGLDGNNVIPNIHIPPLALTKPILYDNLTDRDADVANVEMGDVAIVVDVQKSYIYSGSGYIELVTTGSISSINGKSGGSVQINTVDIPEVTNLYYTETRVSANTDLVSNTNRITSLESFVHTWYESESQETCDEVFPSSINEITSTSQGTSFTPISGTYRCTLNTQFELTKGGTIISRVPAAINNTIDQLNVLTYVAHAAAYGAGEVLTAGNYYIAGATTHTGILEFDAQNDSDALFIIKCGAAHAVEVNASYILSNGAKSSNIIWYVVGALSVGANVTIRGTFIGDAAVGIGTNCILDGRLFTTNGAITTGNVMALPVDDTYSIDLGVSSQFVLFSIFGDITNPLPGTNPSIINSGIIACGTGTVLGFSPYDGTYTVDPETDPTIRVLFGIYNGVTLVPSSLTYKETKLIGKYYSISASCTLVSTGDVISAKVGIDSEKGGVIITNRTLFASRIFS